MRNILWGFPYVLTSMAALMAPSYAGVYRELPSYVSWHEISLREATTSRN
jgi:hypothetical protein